METKNNSYLVVTINNEQFSIHSENVIFITNELKMSKIPLTEEHILGMVNYQGNFISVVDTKYRLYNKHIENNYLVITEFTVDNKTVKLALAVEKVNFVVDILDKDIDNSSSEFLSIKKYISGFSKIDDKFVMILNIDKLV